MIRPRRDIDDLDDTLFDRDVAAERRREPNIVLYGPINYRQVGDRP